MAATTTRHSTPSTLSEWSTYPTINNDTAQQRLARAMGYPPGWRVIRTLIQIPLPPSMANAESSSPNQTEGAPKTTLHDDGSYTVTAVQDRIYAGDPATQPDGYYNHSMALIAASKYPWRPQYDDVIHDNNDDDFDDKEYCSTSHKNRGGQLKGRKPKYEEGDVVEVLYVEDEEDEDEEREWYEATVLRRVEYEDDIRYCVHYHADDAEQSNVREEYIRATHKTKQKKKAKSTSRKRQAKSESDETPKRKAGRPKGSKNKSAARKSVEKEYIPTADEVDLATEIGLPNGWGASKKERKPFGFKWTIKSPDGKTFDSKKKAFAHAGCDMPEDQKSAGRPRKRKAADIEEEVETVEELAVVDEGDPPWRTSEHAFLNRRVRWTPPEDNVDLPHEAVVGTVIGWISETDVDSEGNPGFESSKTGQPACLFHVVFDDFEQDFEEWELEEIFI